MKTTLRLVLILALASACTNPLAPATRQISAPTAANLPHTLPDYTP